MPRSLVSAILNTDLRSWVFGGVCWFFLFLTRYASCFIRHRDVGPPRLRIDSTTYLLLAVIAAWCQAWAVGLIWLVLFSASFLFGLRASLKDLASQKYLSRHSGDRTVLIVPNLSRRLDGTDPLLLPQACLDRLSDAEVDALLARQAAARSRWPLLLAGVIPLIVVILGVRAALRSPAPLVSIAGMLCFWALVVWMYRRLDAQADAKAIRATGDPATYIQALVKADRLMQEIPARLRMSTWWLFPTSLEARIAAINRHIPEAPQR